MASINSLGIGSHLRDRGTGSNTQYVLIQRPLQRLMAFRGRDINDIVNNPIVKNEMLGYWKVFKQIQRGSERLDLERQWNSLGQRL